MEFIEDPVVPHSSDAMILERLAQALGHPVTVFDQPGSGAIHQTSELLRLWLGVEDVGDRTKVFAFVQSKVSPPRP